MVWQNALYLQEGNSKLKNLTSPHPHQSDPAIHNNIVHRTIMSIVLDQQLSPSAFSLTFFYSNLDQPAFYMISKIHKIIRNPGRPIVSAWSCPTEQISKFLDSLFQSLVTPLPSYLKDTKHALTTFDSFTLYLNELNVIIYLFLMYIHFTLPSPTLMVLNL